MAVKVSLKPISTIKANLGIEPNGKVHAEFTKRCAEYMDKYIPRRLGTIGGSLRENKTITTNTITYEMPYAHAQYVGYTTGPVKNYSTAGTGPYWDERMKTIDMPTIVEEMQDFISRGGK